MQLKIKITDNEVFKTEMKMALADNDGYCPCRINKTPDTKCMCKDFRDMQEEGYCHCGLYEKYYEDEQK